MGSFSYKAHFDSANETYTGDNNTVNEIRNSAAIPFGKAINGLLRKTIRTITTSWFWRPPAG